MKPGVAITVASVIGLLLPVAVVFSASYFYGPSHSPKLVDTPQVSARPIEEREPQPDAAEGNANQTQVADEANRLRRNVRSVANRSGLNPVKEKVFLLNFVSSFLSLPATGSRHKLISKYNASKHPNTGWAMALTRFPTSLRPEIYWRDAAGRGSWLTFDHLNIRKGNLYSFTILVQPGSFLSVSVQNLTLFREQQRVRTGEIVSPTQPAEVTFLGGVSVEDFSSVATEEPLAFGGSTSRRNAFRGEIQQLLVAQLDELPKRNVEISKLLSGGAMEIAKRLPPEQIELLIDEKGKDLSVHQSEVGLAKEPKSQASTDEEGKEGEE